MVSASQEDSQCVTDSEVEGDEIAGSVSSALSEYANAFDECGVKKGRRVSLYGKYIGSD